MTLFLASVRDPGEAEMALGAGADIIDLKDPEQGALGALSAEAMAACVRRIAGRAPVSATIGDIPLERKPVCSLMRSAAASGADYVKLGLFPGGDAQACFDALGGGAAELSLILVLFADALPEFDAFELAAKVEACGVMFDTLGKDGGTLVDHLPPAQLAAQIAAAKARGLTVGLAGSLKAKHIPGLLALEPDLLGFRSALCREGDRIQPLDPLRLSSIRALIPRVARNLPQPNLPNLASQTLC
jgi:dihydroneopterin aldolase